MVLYEYWIWNIVNVKQVFKDTAEKIFVHLLVQTCRTRMPCLQATWWGRESSVFPIDPLCTMWWCNLGSPLHHLQSTGKEDVSYILKGPCTHHWPWCSLTVDMDNKQYGYYTVQTLILLLEKIISSRNIDIKAMK